MGLNVKFKIRKLLEDSIGESLGGLGYGNNFSTPNAQSLKEKIDKVNYVKIKNFCSVKTSIKTMRLQAIDWEKIFAKDTSDRGLSPKIYKELLKFSSKKMNNLIKNWAKDLNR